MERNPVTESRILDLLAAAVQDERNGMRRGEPHVYNWRRVFFLMTTLERVAFDLFLVRTKDQLAYEPGTVENRFRERVQRMAKLAEFGTLPEGSN